MEKIWIDANVILRYLLKDNEEFYAKAYEIMKKADSRELKLLVSPLTIAEVVWTLESFYKISKDQISDTLNTFICSEAVEAEERDTLILSLNSYRENNVDFIDAYIAAHAINSGNKKVFTFDKKHFSRLNVELF